MVDLRAEIMVERGELGVLHRAIMPAMPDLDERRAASGVSASGCG
jgi:hypothetical protein